MNVPQMTNSMRSSAASANCPPTRALGGGPPARAFGSRIAWRPSRWLLAILAALTLLAPFAVLASEMPRMVAWPLALAALLHGLWSIGRERRRSPCVFVFAGDDVPVLLDGEAIDGVTVQWRGPLAFVRWRGSDGRVHRRSWWPDTLPPARRRELRLAAPAPVAASGAASMAP